MKVFCCRETRAAKYARLHDWHPFFAIFPRWDGVQCWHVGWIERKGAWTSDGWDWEYRALDLENYP